MKKVLFLTLFLLLSIFSLNISKAQTNPYCYTFRYYLVRGSTDANTAGEVSRLQSILYKARFLETEPTGYFGVLTENAVRKYQYSKNIQSTGTVGPTTRAALSNCSSNNYTPSPATGNPLAISFYSFNKKSILPVPFGAILVLPKLTVDTNFPEYVFDGWYSDQNYSLKYNSAPIIVSQSFYAKWVKPCSSNVIAVYPNDCSATPTNTSTTTIDNGTGTTPLPYEPLSTETKECSVGGYFIRVPVGTVCP